MYLEEHVFSMLSNNSLPLDKPAPDALKIVNSCDMTKQKSWKPQSTINSSTHIQIHATQSTLDPLTWYEEIKNFNDDIEGNKKKEFKKQTARKFLADHIVIHINFATSKVEMNILDARWTLMDRIAKLGGTLGLCAQITGGTFLTMIHLLVLIIKACFNCWFKHQT